MAKQIPISKATQKKIIYLFEEGLPVTEISPIVNILTSRLKRFIARHYKNDSIFDVRKQIAYDKYGTSRFITPARLKLINKAAERYNQEEYSLGAASKIFGLSREGIRQLLNDADEMGLIKYHPNKRYAKNKIIQVA